ncbi:phospholipase C [Tumebacillus sp. BK434]|uniref:alkaline phosphatase family protein n=1 Tax=Tumebacillus sp. BK434 TaxID=2512169 RepID=UPI0010518CD5|nr:alkaline phosphatase family protein [Tumebacillus sp. BK434]TCP59620.1 phospholipase C [Tumebacillus sp. BK434]
MTNALEKIEHLVVLMLENRSFDNLAGWLYDKKNPPPRGQAFEGLSGKRFSNPIPAGVPGADRKRVSAGRGSHDLHPDPEPGEPYEHVNVQLYGEQAAADPLPEIAPMNGFVRDYINILQSLGRPVQYENYKIIMDSFMPQQVPVFSELARQYAICDRWFCAVPSQTWTNRSFFHAATSSGLTDNAPYVNWIANDSATIFDRMSEAGQQGLNWKVYYDRQNQLPLTLLIHFPRLLKYRRTNFCTLDAFYRDAAAGALPSYAFLEPQFLNYDGGRNDQHPPYSVAEGERLIRDVYRAVRNGKGWEKTLLVITYDEHGGCFDHVPPPRVAPPQPHAPSGQHGFRFDRLGVRVPTLLVSPYIEAGTVYRAQDENGQEVPLDHCSVIKTITKRWGLQPLTVRDEAAYDLSGVLTRKTPRTDDPVLPEPKPTSGEPLQTEPTDFYLDIAGLIAARIGEALALLRGAKLEQSDLANVFRSFEN